MLSPNHPYIITISINKIWSFFNFEAIFFTIKEEFLRSSNFWEDTVDMNEIDSYSFFTLWNFVYSVSFTLNTLCNLPIATNSLAWWHLSDLIIIKVIREFIMWILKIDMARFSAYQYGIVVNIFSLLSIIVPTFEKFLSLIGYEVIDLWVFLIES